MIHIAAMSAWLGGLFMLALFLLPKANATELAAIVPVWSRWAQFTVAALLVTGVAQALVEVGAIAPFFQTTYGWLILTKVILVGAVLAVAVFSRRLVEPIARRATGAAARLRTLVAAEAVGVLVIVGVAAVLVQTTPARATPSGSAPPTVQSAQLTDKLFTLTVDDSPAKVGINELHLYATTPSGQLGDVKEWTVTASLPDQGIENLGVSVLPVTPDHAIGQVTLPQAGTWTFSFTLRTSDIDESTVTTTFVVSN
jgi:copper transport protein